MQLKCFERKQITNRIVGLGNRTSGKRYSFVNLKTDNIKYYQLAAYRWNPVKIIYSVIWISSCRLTLPNIKSPPKTMAKRAIIIPMTREVELSYFWNEYKKYPAATADIRAKTANSKSFTKITSVIFRKGKTSEVSPSLSFEKSKAYTIMPKTFKLLNLECKV